MDRAEILEHAQAVDAEERAFGDARGDELPPELATAKGARSGSAKLSAGWMPSAPSKHGRSPGHDPSD